MPAASSARHAHVFIPPGILCKQSLLNHTLLRSLPGRPRPDQLQQDWGAGGPQNHRAPLEGHQGGDAGQPRQLRSLLPQGQHQRKGAGSALLAPHWGTARHAHLCGMRRSRCTPPLLTSCARVQTQVRDSGARSARMYCVARAQNPASRATLPPVPPGCAQITGVHGSTTTIFSVCAGVKQRGAFQRRGPGRAEVRISAHIAAAPEVAWH